MSMSVKYSLFRGTVRRWKYLLIVLLALIGLGHNAASFAQQVPPPGMTFSCSPNPLYIYSAATCSVHVAGGATGQVAIAVNGGSLPTLDLDSNGNASFSTAGIANWQAVLTGVATYEGNSQYSPALAYTTLNVVSGKPVVTANTLTCSPYELYAGNTATCTLHLTATGATGTVTFSVVGGGGAAQTVALDGNGNATISGEFGGLAAGNYEVQAVYSGDQNFAGFPVTTTETILSSKPLPSAMNVSCVPAPVTQGGTGSCQVQVAGGVTGTVSLYVNGQPVAMNLTLDSNGSASTASLFGSLPVGAAAVSATYLGDGNFGSATAGTTVNIVSTDSQPTMSVSCSPVGLTQNQSGTCTALLSEGATGQVTFQIDGASLPPINVSASSATIPISAQALTVGSHSILATYSGDDNFVSDVQGTGLQVSAQPSATAPVNLSCVPATIVGGGSTTCYANVGQGPTGAVMLYLGPNFTDGEGVDANGIATFSNVLAGVPAGTYTLAAHYLGDLNYTGGGASLSVQIQSQATSPVIQASVTPSTIQNGGQLSLTTSVAPGATGAVTVSVNGQPLGQLVLNSGGNASGIVDFTGSLGNGTYTLTFSYPGDSNFSPSSTTATVTVASQTTTNPPVTGPALERLCTATASLKQTARPLATHQTATSRHTPIP